MLTDKAKTEFEKWLFSNHRIQLMDGFNNLPESCQHALIIEWFESIGFHIGRDMVNNWWLENSTYYENHELDGYDYYPTIKTQAQAITKANEIFNNLTLTK